MPGTQTEVHMGIVTNNDDPEKRGRLKVLCQSLVGANTELPEWCEPDAPPFMSLNGGGCLFLPEIGSTVDLLAAVHDQDMDEYKGERFLANPSIRWRHAPPTADNPQPIPDDLKTNYPNRRGFITPAGHKIILDDSGSLIIEGKDAGKIEMKPDGSITMSAPTLVGVGATELMILGNLFMSLYNAHTHLTGVGPSAPPTIPMTTAHLSAVGNKVA